MTTASQREEVEARRAVMRVCAAARRDELADLVTTLGGGGEVTDLRAPEPGLVMLRGRIGGEGAAFNLGEATAVRAAVQAPSGAQGFSYHLGRDRRKARLAAIVDAFWQEPALRLRIEAGVEKIAERLQAEARLEAERTAATRVNFFTVARGED
ncbi:MAG TPA: phosphonate C-P lyase system protein PhnG [Mesorhizobium sp.]|jgi:alpha-D-ribose 1-methylphosphonate 5-triphosphate synthase subunit PhnG|nr:phosphonate C-P lyase system protein PhnG [Mesorhizobium sp.]